MKKEEMLTTAEVANLLGISKQRVSQLVKEGRLFVTAKSGVGPKAASLFSYDEVDKFIKSKEAPSYCWNDIWKEFTEDEQGDILLAINLLDKAVPGRTTEQKAFLKRLFSSVIDLDAHDGSDQMIA